MNIIKAERYGDQIRLTEYINLGYFSKSSNNGKGRIAREEYDPSESASMNADGGIERSESPTDEVAPDRFYQSIQRARARVRELALCNSWDYFCTFTLNEEKQDRFDLAKWVKDFGVWIGNYNKKFGTSLKYILVPEQHKDGAWHMHGLLSGVSPESISVNEFGYDTIKYYENRFGFINLSKVRDSNKSATYVAKYITKGGSDIAKNKRMFFASRGLAGREFVEYFTTGDDYASDWYNEWVGLRWLTVDEYRRLTAGQ